MSALDKRLPAPTTPALVPTLPKHATARHILQIRDKSRLPALRQQVERACRPIARERCEKCVAYLMALVPKQARTMGQDPKVFVRGMTDMMCKYPEEVVNLAIGFASEAGHSFSPDIKAMADLCKKYMMPRWQARRALRIKEHGIKWQEDYWFILRHSKPTELSGDDVIALMREGRGATDEPTT